MEHFNITFKPDGKSISIHAGATIAEAAGQVDIVLNSICGGKGTCRKCVVNLEPSGAEVLACQYKIQSDLVITIPAASRYYEQKILTSGIETGKKFVSDIYKKYISVKTKTKIFGLAIDIGTTTVVVKLIDMLTGQNQATEAAVNPQIEYGDDVINRIAYAETEAGLTKLHNLIIDCINGLIMKLCDKTSVSMDQIYEACIVGNTTMNHIFLKYPVTSLGQAPYKAHSLDVVNLSAEQSALKINPAGNVHLAPNIAGFVGADTTAVALAVDINSTKEIVLAIDIGTNGELILGTKDKLYAASCAAGPALEGARINYGSRAAEGAIEAVVINDDDIDVDVIGNCQPRSVCGSGLIDAVAVLLDLGLLDISGRFKAQEDLPDNTSAKIVSRIMQVNNQPAFTLSDTGERKVILTQQDIRQVQLAKGAIRAGIKLLQKKTGFADDDIEKILLAGAFGNYIRKESAVRIGLLPDVSLERIHPVGNAAGSGAQMMLISSQWRQLAQELARSIEYVEIAHQPDFGDCFAESMLF